MAGNLTDYAEKLAMDFLMTTGAATRPTAWYVGLASAATDDTATGGAEVTGTGYARQAVTFPAATSGPGSTANSAAVTFTAGGAWGTVTDFIICDAATGGNRLWHGPLNASRTFAASGDSLTIAAGALQLSID